MQRAGPVPSDGAHQSRYAAEPGASDSWASSRRMWRSFMMRGGEAILARRATKMGSGLPWPSGSSLRSQPASTGVMRSSGSSA